MNVNLTFGQWLGQIIEEKGWTQSEMARRGKISPSAVQQVVAGITRPGPKMCKAVAKAFAFEEEDVFRRAGIMAAPSKPTRNQIKARRIVYQVDNGEAIEQLLALWKKLEPDDQTVVLELMARLARLPEPRIIGDPPED